MNIPEMNLLEHEVYELFERAGLSTPASVFAKRDELPDLKKQANYVAKIVSREILHKSDCGGIVFGVTMGNAADVHEKLVKKFPSAEGVLYAEEIKNDGEMLIGAYNDRFFGPLVTVGYGGAGADFYDLAMKEGMARISFPAELAKNKVKELLEKLPIVMSLTGKIRGCRKVAELEGIVEVVAAFQKLITSEIHGGQIEEVEANPIVCTEKGLIALDGVCRTKEAGAGLKLRPIAKISKLLNPRSVCIAGASGKNPSNPANVILKNLRAAGLAKIFILHPKEKNIDGVDCFPTLRTIVEANGGKPVDLLVVGVPARIAAGVIEESLKLNAASSIQIISAGFGETISGKRLQDELEKKVENVPVKDRPVINGPNTLGNIFGNIRTLFTAPSRSSSAGRGLENTALICQSGAFMITRASNLAGVLNPSVCVSVGNQMDLSVADFLEHLISDPKLKTFGLYIEGLKDGDGKRLMELSRRAVSSGKFVVVYKAGRTKAGVDAAKGHTAAQAGSYPLFRELLASSGAMIADTFSEFQDIMMLASLAKEFLRSRPFQVAALSNAGFEKCAIADHLMRNENSKFALAEYAPETIEKIKATYSSHNISEIMDVHDILDLTPMMDDAGYEEIIRATLCDPNVSFGIYSIVPETLMLNIKEAGSGRNDAGGILERLVKINADVLKPFCVSIESGWKYDEFAAKCLAVGIPAFRSADQAARAVEKFLNSVLVF